MKSQQKFSMRLSALTFFCVSLILPVAPAQAAEELYFADIFYPDFSSGYIYKVNTDGSGLETVLDIGGGLRGLAIDQAAGKLYWTHVGDDAIRRANLDGSNPEDLITTGLAWPMGIDVYPAADMLSWGDQTLAQIGAAQLDGSGAAPLLATPFHSGIAFDTVNDKIYWSTSITSSEGEILRADLNGSNVETAVTGVDKPARIALDIAGGKIYWTDYVVDVVRRANLDGSGVEDLYVVGANLNPDGIALDLSAGKVYWGQAVTDNRDKIMRMNLDGTSPEDVLTGNFGLIAAMALLSLPSHAPDVVDPTTVLHGNWPNPFTHRTTVGLSLAEHRFVRLVIYSIDGRRVATLIHDAIPAGRHSVLWDGTDDRGHGVPNGVYYGLLEAGDFNQTMKMILLK